MPGTEPGAIDGEFWESLESWRRLARKTAALLRMANQLSAGDRLTGDCFESWEPWAYLFEKLGLAEQRSFFVRPVNMWVRHAGIHPSLRWKDDRKTVTIEYYGAFGAAMAQALSIIGGSWRFCSGCGKYFLPKRQRTTGKRDWCDKCIGIRGATMARESRARKKARTASRSVRKRSDGEQPQAATARRGPKPR
jgi:hypothetical protein